MQCFDFRKLFWVALAFAAALVALEPSAVLAEAPVISVRGGGVGEFLDPNPCDGFQTEAPFGVSNFSVSARIYADGTADGHFMCQVKGCVVIVQGKITDVMGIDQADGDGDQDTVFLHGHASFVDLSKEAGGPGVVKTDNGEPYVFEFCIELREGPGTGQKGRSDDEPPARFFYTDEVVLLGGVMGLDDGYDEEEIRKGHIEIEFKGDVDDIPFDRVKDCPVEPLPL